MNFIYQKKFHIDYCLPLLLLVPIFYIYVYMLISIFRSIRVVSRIILVLISFAFDHVN